MSLPPNCPHDTHGWCLPCVEQLTKERNSYRDTLQQIAKETAILYMVQMARETLAAFAPPPRPAQEGEWEYLTKEPCVYCGLRGGVYFLPAHAPSVSQGHRVCRCSHCRRAWLSVLSHPKERKDMHAAPTPSAR